MSRRTWLLLVIGAITGLGLFILLTWSTGSASRLAHFHELLVYLNLALALGLFGWVLGLSIKLIRQLRRGKFGARLTARFALAFALIGVLPGALIYTVSIQFMTRSIESWFNVRVDTALDAGLALGRAALDAQINELDTRARAMLPGFAEATDAELPALLDRVREVTGVREAMVMTSSGRPIAFVTEQLNTLLPQGPPVGVLNQLRISGSYAGAEPVSNTALQSDPSGLILRVILPLGSSARTSNLLVNSEVRWLQLVKAVPEDLVMNAEEVREGYRDYQELALSRQGLRQLFGVTLTLALLLAVFAAMAVALFLSKRLVQPLLVLASGTQAVSVGDFRPLAEPPQNDEVGQLTRSFNAMTRQLEEARRLVDMNRRQLEQSKLYTEGILANLSAGVLVFDEFFRITLFNQGAQSILGIDLRAAKGRPLETVPGALVLASTVKRAFSQLAATNSERLHWQEQFEITLPSTDDPEAEHTITLLARGTHLSLDGRGNGYVVVFDDITAVISANRTVAWGEVARRMAHEIKNPLTPIQLSAERLAMKLEHKLEPTDAELLKRSTNTIINQVGSLKHMVDEFREYARRPPLVFTAIDLNHLIEEVLILYGWDPVSKSASSDPAGIRFESRLTESLPMVRGDETQLRQVIHNLLSNARDAIQESGKPGTVQIVTERVENAGMNTRDEQPAVRLIVTDDGPGFAGQLLQQAFEPYITTKTHGTGLGLAIVKKIVDEHGGYIDISNRRSGGARVTILLMPMTTAVDDSASEDDNGVSV
ncbi:MAG: ATP-binding protein [Burkholderiaceae bacterium]|nr:ATP-binding protein [Burkholderiaceae bacterium]MCD8515807.1 ATP-binding protein [Burkholderiaceae bacterium]MCD8536037.1 ATP-binding protein [Burkholderiaceae bacterium]MCD8564141.1 ATP-binding protein [Burkholderiaceae bacterium]